MNRRNVLIGLTAAATGSSVVFGSGAFTQVQADRSLTIGVSEDASALLALDAGDDVASVYNNGTEDGISGGNGELVIDTTKLSSNDEGFNVGANVQIGRTVDDNGDTVDFADPNSIGGSSNVNVVTDTDDNAAFKLTNNFETDPGGIDDDVKVTIDTKQITASGDGGADGTLDASLYFIGTKYSDGSPSETKVTERSDNTDESKTYTMSHDDEVYFAIYIDTDGTTNPDDFTGSVTISAEPNQEQ